MSRRRRITCSPLVHIPPGQECALVAQSYAEQKWSHFVGIKDRGERFVAWWWWELLSPASLLFPKPFKWVTADWKGTYGHPAKYLFHSCASLLPPWLCQSHRLASNLIFQKKKKKERNCCLWKASLLSSEGNLFTPRGAMHEAVLDHCCLITLMLGTDAGMWECVCYLCDCTHTINHTQCVISFYAYFRVSLKHNLSEYNRGMEWDWHRLFINRRCRVFGVVSPHSWLFAPPPVSNDRPLVSKILPQKNSPVCAVMAEPQLCPWTWLPAKS